MITLLISLAVIINVVLSIVVVLENTTMKWKLVELLAKIAWDADERDTIYTDEDFEIYISKYLPSWLAELVSCYYCYSTWFAVVIGIFTAIFATLPWWFPLLCMFSVHFPVAIANRLRLI